MKEILKSANNLNKEKLNIIFSLTSKGTSDHT